MGDLADERRRFEADVEAEAARLVRDGICQPHEAIDRAQRIVLEQRRRWRVRDREPRSLCELP